MGIKRTLSEWGGPVKADFCLAARVKGCDSPLTGTVVVVSARHIATAMHLCCYLGNQVGVSLVDHVHMVIRCKFEADQTFRNRLFSFIVILLSDGR